MLFKHITVSNRLLIVLAIGTIFQAGVSVVSLLEMRQSVITDRTIEVKHLLESAYSIVSFYHDQASQGLISDVAARKAAADAVRAMRYDGTNYFFIWDLRGASVAHGAQPELEGKIFAEGPDADRNPVIARMVRKLIDVANSEKKEGLTVYRSLKSGQTAALDTVAYSKLFEPWGWSIGTGVYVDDVEESFNERSMWIIFRTLALMGLAGALTFALGQDLAQVLARLSARVAGVARGELDGEVKDTDRTDEVGQMARALLLLRDTSKEAAELRLDQLTGLPTRKLMMDRLVQVQARSARGGNFGAVMLIDLDKFKTINDTHGHDVGDMLLREVAQRLSARVREGDTVARLGGDEFVVVLVDLGRSEKEAATAAEGVCEKILAILSQTYQFGTLCFTASASIGITLVMGDGTSADALLKQADLAMYKSKESGRNVCRFFDARMEEVVNARTILEKELRLAVASGQFTLHYQPQIGRGNELKGAEALVRWVHPRRGLVHPAEFIPLAEETGLILPLGRWVLETACEQLAKWAGHPELGKLKLAVNVSPRQFRQPDFVEQAESILQRSGADPERLTLEITETLMIKDVDETIEKMIALKSKGISFAIDDFGTGYSSLYILKRLPLDQLKIDRSFVRDVLSDPNDAAIADMIVMLAKTLGLEVVAEGVETAEQLDFLANSGCHVSQGHVFSRPLPLEAFEQYARQHTLGKGEANLDRRSVRPARARALSVVNSA
jgi:diguanylate cyclase (GGDEF)-like protein